MLATVASSLALPPPELPRTATGPWRDVLPKQGRGDEGDYKFTFRDGGSLAAVAVDTEAPRLRAREALRSLHSERGDEVRRMHSSIGSSARPAHAKKASAQPPPLRHKKQPTIPLRLVAPTPHEEEDALATALQTWGLYDIDPSGWDPSNFTEAAQASSQCPTRDPPAGLLFNHISKTGGTAFKHLLRDAMSAPSVRSHVENEAQTRPSWPPIRGSKRLIGRGWPTPVHNHVDVELPYDVTFVSEEHHLDPDGADAHLFGDDGALVVQEDEMREMRLTSADAASFFVVGLVRRPCDYMLSAWASSSANQWEKDAAGAREQGWWGQSPPYNNSADQQRFESWLADVTSNRDSHRGYYDVNGVKFMSAAIAERYVNPNLVNCWVRTHAMVDDLAACMEQYEGCGGKYDAAGLSAARVAMVAAALAEADAADPPSVHAACSGFFSEAAMASVLRSEQAVIDNYDLAMCCSS